MSYGYADMLSCLCCAAVPRDKARAISDADGATSFQLFPQPPKQCDTVVAEEEEGDFQPNERATKLVEKLKQLAATLEGPFKKYPKNGKHFLSHAESRYLAIRPQSGPDDAAGDNPVAEFVRWKNGRILYWTSKDAYEHDAAERGHVDLLKITKVSWERSSPQKVTLHHKDQDGAYDMTLRFRDSFKAENWARVCWQFRKLLEVKL